MPRFGAIGLTLDTGVVFGFRLGGVHWALFDYH